MSDKMNEKALRQIISALSGEEVSIALEIMLAMHPNRYLNTLALGYITMKSDNDRIKEIVDARANYISFITGNASESPFLDIFEEEELDDPFYRDSLENGVELTDEDDDTLLTETVDPKEIEVPDFLK